MELGIFAKTFVRPRLEEVFQAVASHGLRVVQFNFACAGLASLPDRIEVPLLDRIRRATTAQRVSIAAVSGTFNMIHPDTLQREEGLRRLAVLASACGRLGASVITLCTGSRDPQDMWRHHPENRDPASWRDLTRSMSEALRIAEDQKVILAIEPETNNVVDSARATRRLLDEMKSPRLRVILDPANLASPGTGGRDGMSAVLEEAFDLVGAQIIMCHAKELGADGDAGNLPLGAGVLDWDGYLARLDRAGFSGALVMHGFEEKDVPASVAFLRGKMDSPVRA